LAAGTTQTPQILELSGIGRSSVLQAHGITPIIDHAGVGENLQDHGIAPLGYEVADGLPSRDMARDPEVAAAAMAAYQKDGSGSLGMVPLTSAFMPCVDLGQPELEEILQKIEASIKNPEISITHRKQFEVLRGLIKNPEEPTAQYMLAPFQVLPRAGDDPKSILSLSHPGFFISMVAALSYPLSRGSVHIQSANPQDAPLIDHRMLHHPVDLKLHARHTMWLEKIAEAEPMASLLKKGGERLHATEPLTDIEKAKEICKELVLSVYHVSGTCAMIPREDGGVVDTKLKVYGTTNLRIVDASIFPLEARGNIQATVYAVAEKAADIIRERWS
jgi:choline dehydrogenase-like flavoprotein